MSTEHKSPYAYYKEYGKENDASVESDYNKIKGDTSTLLSDYKTALDQSYETAEKKLNEQAAAQTAALPQQYRSAFDKNELQQRINERQLQERMQRMGLTNSGLNRSQQTALQLQRSNADQAVGQQKNAAAAQIQQQKQAALDDLTMQNQQAYAQAQYNLRQQQQAYLASLLAAAADRRADFANNYYSGELSRYDIDTTDKYNRDKLSTEDLFNRYKVDTEDKYNRDLMQTQRELSEQEMAHDWESDQANNRSDLLTRLTYLVPYNALDDAQKTSDYLKTLLENLEK